MTAFYDFNEIVFDQTGHGHDGILAGNATAEGVLDIPADNQSTVILPNGLLDGALDFTISCRVKFHAFQTMGAAPINVIINGFSDNNAFVIGYRKLANIVHLTFEGIGTDLPLNAQLIENQWYCFIFTRNGTEGKVYLDGEMIGSPVQISAAPLVVDGLVLGQDQDCLFGCFASNQSLNGQLENLRVFHRALAQNEIATFCQTSTENITICEGEKYEGYGQTGEFTDFFETATACDSMRFLNLLVNPAQDTSFEKIICHGESFLGFTESGFHKIILLNQWGCDSVLNINLVVSEGIYAPNSFSPNDDGINDSFLLFGGNASDVILEFQIFDRWGELVLEAKNIAPNDLTAGWDGIFKGKNAAAGVYIWTASVGFGCGENKFLKGDFNLLR